MGLDPDHTLMDWFSSPLGKDLLNKEAKAFEAVVMNLSSPTAVQLGPVIGDYLASANAAHRIRLVDHYCQGVDACVLSEALPLNADSVNLMVLPHTLDYCIDARHVLREVHRVLMAEGKLVLLGFNPLSSWGVRRIASSSLPWSARFIRLGRVKEWLRVLGFEISGGSMLYYSPPTQNTTIHRACEWMEYAGDRWWPMLAAVYCLVATKREIGLTPIRPEWKLKTNLIPGFTEPVTRSINTNYRR